MRGMPRRTERIDRALVRLALGVLLLPGCAPVVGTDTQDTDPTEESSGSGGGWTEHDLAGHYTIFFYTEDPIELVFPGLVALDVGGSARFFPKEGCEQSTSHVGAWEVRDGVVAVEITDLASPLQGLTAPANLCLDQPGTADLLEFGAVEVWTTRTDGCLQECQLVRCEDAFLPEACEG